MDASGEQMRGMRVSQQSASQPDPQPERPDPLHAERTALVQAQVVALAMQQMTKQEAALLTGD
jgi:hypothetical protein